MSKTDQFKNGKTDQFKNVGAFEAFIAVWANDGKHTLIGAPTLELLKKSWLKVTGHALNVERVQRVALTQRLCDGGKP